MILLFEMVGGWFRGVGGSFLFRWLSILECAGPFRERCKLVTEGEGM